MSYAGRPEEYDGRSVDKLVYVYESDDQLVTAAGNSNYKSATRKVTFIVKVR